MKRSNAFLVLTAAVMLTGCGEDGERGWPQFEDIGAGLLGVAGSSIAWGDYDNDGDLDLVLAGDDYSTRISKVYRNDGAGVFTEIAAGLEGVEDCSLAWGDYDNDDDLDLALAGRPSTSKIYRNNAGTFVDINAGLTEVSDCSLAWGDYDNDGDLDIAISGMAGAPGMTAVYRNDQGSFTDIGAGLRGAFWCSLAWGDYDNDGDLDIVVVGEGGGAGYVADIYRNDAGTFTDIGAGLVWAYMCSLAWGDFDNDGDLDLAVAGSGSPGGSFIYRNDAGTFTDIGAGLPGVDMCSLAWGDYDNDGDLDLALAGRSYGGPISNVYRNDGGGLFVEICSGLTSVAAGCLAFGDYDSDGDLDLALAGSDSMGNYISKVYRNRGGVFNAAPAAPTGLSASYTGTGPYDVTFSWDAATDAETPAPGLSYNIRVRDESGGGVMPGMADDATGYRRIPALGNAQKRCYWILKGLASGGYYWSVQAIDTAFAGSPWAPEETVTVP